MAGVLSLEADQKLPAATQSARLRVCAEGTSKSKSEELPAHYEPAATVFRGQE